MYTSVNITDVLLLESFISVIYSGGEEATEIWAGMHLGVFMLQKLNSYVAIASESRRGDDPQLPLTFFTYEQHM